MIYHTLSIPCPAQTLTGTLTVTVTLTPTLRPNPNPYPYSHPDPHEVVSCGAGRHSGYISGLQCFRAGRRPPRSLLLITRILHNSTRPVKAQTPKR